MDIVCDILRKHLPPDVRAWVFGSRADWTTKNSSDLDIALEGDGRLRYKTMSSLEYAFEESDLPYTVDVVDLKTANPTFRQIVDKQKMSLEFVANSHNLSSPSNEFNNAPETWMPAIFSDVIAVNPKRNVKKGNKVKFVSMWSLEPLAKTISNYSIKNYSGGSKFQNGDTLFVRISPGLENGQTAYVDFLDENESGAGSTEFIVLRNKDGKLDPLFVYYLSRTDQVRDIAIRSMTGTSGRKRVETGIFEKINIHIPPTSEQKTITKILSDLDSKIELNKKMNKTLEEMAQTIFKSWFVDYEFPDENGKPYRSSGGQMKYNEELGKEIPMRWNTGNIHDISNVVYGAAFGSKLFNKEKKGLGLIRIRDLKNHTPEFYATEEHPKKAVILPGDIIAGMDAEYRPHIWLGEKSLLNQRMCIFRSKDPFYKYFILNAIQSLLHLDKSMRVRTTIHLGKSDIAMRQITIPTNSITKKFHFIVDNMFTKIVGISLENKILSQIRDSLLPKLVSGKIRVPLESE